MPAPSKSFTVLADSAVDPDSPIDTALMTALRDNDVHLEEWLGLSYTAAQNHDHDGANSKPVVGVADGSITEPKLGAGAVAQAKLKTAVGSVSTVNGSLTNLTLPGGTYGFYPQIRNTNGSGTVSAQVRVADAQTSYITNLALAVPNTTGTAEAQQQYIQASPPYDLGDGEVPLFVFALIDGLGKLVATYIAGDPPWANNGPTIIRPDFSDDQGRKFRRMRPRMILSNLTDPANRDAELAKLDAEPQLVEITQAVKQADMPLIPHPFWGELTGKTVVLIDPVSAICERLLRMHEEFAGSNESVALLLHGDYLQLGNTPLPRAAPPGVMAVTANWKLTA